jgi:hypothetical protein
MNALLELSEGLRRMLEVVARASGWLLVVATVTWSGWRCCSRSPGLAGFLD